MYEKEREQWGLVKKRTQFSINSSFSQSFSCLCQSSPVNFWFRLIHGYYLVPVVLSQNISDHTTVITRRPVASAFPILVCYEVKKIT